MPRSIDNRERNTLFYNRHELQTYKAVKKYKGVQYYHIFFEALTDYSVHFYNNS